MKSAHREYQWLSHRTLQDQSLAMVKACYAAKNQSYIRAVKLMRFVPNGQCWLYQSLTSKRQASKWFIKIPVEIMPRASNHILHETKHVTACQRPYSCSEIGPKLYSLLWLTVQSIPEWSTDNNRNYDPGTCDALTSIMWSTGSVWPLLVNNAVRYSLKMYHISVIFLRNPTLVTIMYNNAQQCANTM